MRGLVVVAVLTGVLAAGCGHKPPYSRGNQPAVDDLLAGTRPQLPALIVSDANVTINRLYRADLAMLAQDPGRFRGTVSKAGLPLVALAFHEDGYRLNSFNFEGLQSGTYHGPPDPCAVERMLSVPFTYEGLVALVLGGAPIIDEPRQILDQRWDRPGGFEALVLANAEFIQELRFAWVGGQWRFAGSVLWRRQAGGGEPNKGALLWQLEHDKHGQVGGRVLPGRTRIRAPGPKRDNLVVINYKVRDPEPPWAKPPNDVVADTGGDDGGDDGGWEDSGGWEDGDQGWEDGEDDGWEDGAAPEGTVPADPPTAPEDDGTSEADGAVVGITAFVPASPPTSDATAPAPIPRVFVMGGEGLADRGDLCK